RDVGVAAARSRDERCAGSGRRHEAGAQHRDLGAYPHAERLGRRLAAGAPQQLLDAALELGLAEAGRALLEVRAQPAGVDLGDLGVDVLLEALERLLAPALLAHRLLAHRPSLTSPSSRAWSASSVRSCRRPRCSRDITVPIGVSMISAISLYAKPSTSAR